MRFLTTALFLIAGTATAFAASQFLDSASLGKCSAGRGQIELRLAGNGDLAVKLVNLDTSRCNNLKFYDRSSGRNIKAYQIKGTSYTLSKKQREALSEDCQVGIDLSGHAGTQSYYIYTPGCRPARSNNGGGSSSNISYQLSNSGNCKVMKNGRYTNQNTGKDFCQGARGKDMVSYEFSRKGNCKLMINGSYAQKNVSKKYCNAR